MAVRLKLGSYEPCTADPLGRGSIGYFPRMTEAEAWAAGRGVWKVNADKVSRQRFALIIGEGVVRAIGEIAGVTVHDDRIALNGQPLRAGHPIHDRYLGTADPVVNGSQNPVGYCDLDGEDEFLRRPCACGCTETTDRDFLPGHDVRAIQARVREHFHGSPLAFVTWVDDQLTRGTSTTTTRKAR